MAEEIIIKLDDKISIPGNSPVVIIGPNGSGKTRFGVTLISRNNAEFISAQRKIILEDNIPMRGLDKANSVLKSQIQSRQSSYWLASEDIDSLFSKLLAEDASSAVKHRDQHYNGIKQEVEVTKKMRLMEVWTNLFPGRSLDFSTYKPTAISDFGSSNAPYPANRMSDGERAALYLGARILNSETNIVIIDEPEVHFHSELAVRFWSTLEKIRNDIRFVYITHDLPFALSRKSAQFVLIKPDAQPLLIPLENGLPRTISKSILGAASFSLHVKQIIFCEGIEGELGDQSFYSSWFNGNDLAVIPVGNCKDVIQCTLSFANDKIVSGLKAIGIVDRDYWPDSYIDSMPDSVATLPFHEIENIFCIKGVFKAVGEQLGAKNIVGKYSSFISKAKSMFVGELLSKQVSERFKCRCKSKLTTVVNRLRVKGDLDELQSEYEGAFHPKKWNFDPKVIFKEERDCLEHALVSDDKRFLQFFPGKVFFPLAAKALGIEVKKYREIVNTALQADESSQLANLGGKLEIELSKYLPQRRTD